MSFFGVQACSSPAKHETPLISMDQLSQTSFSPVSQPTCSQFATSQSGSPQRRVIILPVRGSLSPIKIATSPKRILLPQIFTSSSGNPLPVCAAYTNCSLVGNKHVVAIRNASTSDSAKTSSSVSQRVSSTSHTINSESGDRMLSTRLQVDGILTSSSENASRHGIVSVACHESRVQETSVLSRVTSVSRLPPPASNDSHSVLSDSNVTVSASPGDIHQSSSFMSQLTADKMSSARIARTVNVSSTRKICPLTDIQKRNIVIKLFPEHSSSPDVQMAEQCSPVNATSTSLATSPKQVVLLTPTTTESANTLGNCFLSATEHSTGYAASAKVTTACQPCSSFKTVNLLTGAAKAVSVVSSNICHITVSSGGSQKVIESIALSSDGSQDNSVALMGSSMSNTVAVQMPAENLANSGTRSEDESDDDSVVIIDTDTEPSLPSSPRNSKKRSSVAQNVILLNHQKSSSQHVVDSEHLSSNAVVTDIIEQSRTKRKPVLSTRLLESASDEGIILPVSHGFQLSRRKGFPQRRTDTSGPQLQFCTKQWKRDLNNYSHSTTSPTCKHLQSISTEKDTGGDLSDTADGSPRSEQFLSQSDSQSCQNISDRRKRKLLDQCEPSTFQKVRRSKRSPVRHGSKYRDKNMESADGIVHKAAAVDLGTVSNSLSSESVVTVSSCSTDTSDVTKTACNGDMKTMQQDGEYSDDKSSDLQVLGKDKRSMEMSVTNEDGIVENLLVTIIDISSSEGEDNDDAVEIHSVASAKLDLSATSVPEAETSQSVVPKSVSPGAGNTAKTVEDKSCVSLRTSAPDKQPVSKSYCKTKPVRRKCQQTVQQSLMGRRVLMRRGTASLNDGVDVTKVKQLTQLHRKANSHKRSKIDESAGAVKQLKVDSDSAAAAGSIGPVVRLRGSKHNPVSCCVVSGARDVHDETAAKLKRKPIVLSSSCYPTSFQLQDCVPWRCIFCHQGSSHRTLGDLFGPYYAKMDDSTKSDSVKCQSSSSKSPSHSVKKSQVSGYVPISQRGRPQLQKYAPSVTVKSRRKSQASPDKGIPPEIWLHEDCAIWTNGICLSATGQLCGLEAAITLSLQTVYYTLLNALCQLNHLRL